MGSTGQEVLPFIIRWCSDAFGAPSPSGESNFFALGGDSLAAVELADSLATALGVFLPMEAVFQAETLQELAEEASRELTRTADS